LYIAALILIIKEVTIMRTLSTTAAFLFIVSGFLNGQSNSSEFETNWTQWRGPYETGVAPSGDPPLEWSETTNVKWKSEIPGIGHATPIIWKDQMILLSAIKTNKMGGGKEAEEGQDENDWMNANSTDLIHKFAVISVDRTSGKIQWQTVVREEMPFSKTHQFGSWASNSPVTDGENIYAYFGSHGLYCLNLEGKILWERDLGRMEKVMSFGEGSSPYLYKDKLVVLRDHQGQSAIHVLDKKTGDIIWEAERDEVSSWSTPSVIEFEGSAQIVTAATNKIRSYDIATGKLLWECSGLTRNVIPSPVFQDGWVYLISGFRGNALLAIDLAKASGDISGSDAIVWSYDQTTTPYTPCPVLMDGKLYFLKANNGYLSCLDARDGTEYYANQKLEGIKNIFTSPLGVKDRLYVVGTNGVSSVVKLGEKFEVLSQNTLDDSFYASPVVIGNDLYLRGEKALYCISEE
jgi:outer membrane protein assembly factor BamB